MPSIKKVAEVAGVSVGTVSHVITGSVNVSEPLRMKVQAAIRELLLHAIWIGFRLVDLVNGHDDRNFGGLGVIDGFQRLRHHTVVRRNHDDHDVRHLGAACTHAGKRFVTRRIEEDDLAP